MHRSWVSRALGCVPFRLNAKAFIHVNLDYVLISDFISKHFDALLKRVLL